MSIRDFPNRPDGPVFDSDEIKGWLDRLCDRQNINALNMQSTVSNVDETYVFSVSSNAVKKTTFTALINGVGLRVGTGAPNNADGSNGDYYFRRDGGIGTHLYFKTAGAWGAVI